MESPLSMNIASYVHIQCTYLKYQKIKEQYILTNIVHVSAYIDRYIWSIGVII